MTDNEIIKALECLKGEKSLCNSCSYGARYPDCKKYAIRYIHDLINRQKANAEGLTNAVRVLNEQLSSAKAEAVKYALEWLQENQYINHSPERRKQLVKEMVGEG